MALLRAILGLAAVTVACYAQTPTVPQPQNSSIKTQPSATVPSQLPPSPPDAPIPDLSTIPTQDNSGSPLNRALHRLDPNCLDAIFRLCWSSPPATLGSLDRSRVADDIEVGDSYLKRKNYRGAEFRFEDALSIEPDNAEATFKLAESLAKLGRADEARTLYEAYLKMAPPNGIFVMQAKKALAHLTKSMPR
jgi:tetratricopeptide (TPR) repeat protein